MAHPEVLAVDELSLGHFVTARTFILLHELGHILYGHTARTSAESVRNEKQADAFAATVMKRTDFRDRADVLAEITTYLQKQHGVTCLGALGFEDAYALAMPRGRAQELGIRTLADLAEWPIKTDRETDRQAWSTILHLAVEHRLTLYDAAYLELAVRRGLPMATLDGELRRAAQRQGVALLGNES